MAVLEDYKIRIIANACITRYNRGEKDINKVVTSYNHNEENVNLIKVEIMAKRPDMEWREVE